ESTLGFYMVIAWRVLFLTMLGRDCPEMHCDTVFADEEWKAVYRFGVTNGWLFANPPSSGGRYRGPLAKKGAEHEWNYVQQSYS
ncbi:MAG: hypothetical protein LJE70_06885, partial [Chromatiaceae bacterium]|nr:hypothetical protein [Chromatiaceae bacterium]